MKKSPHQPENHSRLGAIMLFGAWIIGLGLLTYLFNIYLDKQSNPNQKIMSEISTEGTIKVVLLANHQNQYITYGQINDQNVLFLLDTGATDVAIPERVAKRLNLKYGPKSNAMTANGPVQVYLTKINNLKIGDIHLKNIRASIIPNLSDEFILLGMSALKQITFTQHGGELTLIQHTE